MFRSFVHRVEAIGLFLSPQINYYRSDYQSAMRKLLFEQDQMLQDVDDMSFWNTLQMQLFKSRIYRAR